MSARKVWVPVDQETYAERAVREFKEYAARRVAHSDHQPQPASIMTLQASSTRAETREERLQYENGRGSNIFPKMAGW